MNKFENEVFESIEKKKFRVASKSKNAKFEIPSITPAKLKSQMYKVIAKYNSFYKDNSWENVNKMMKGLDRILPNLAIIESRYRHDEFGVPSGKRWTYVGVIEDNKKKKWAVVLDVNAAGAGSVKDPLDKYDITAVVNVLSPRKVSNPDVLDYLEQYKVGN